MKARLNRELRQLARTRAYNDRLGDLGALTALLTDSANEELERLADVRSRLLSTARIIPVDGDVLRTASSRQAEHDLSPQDALVLASVLCHLGDNPAGPSCSPNRNTKDFEDPTIVSELDKHGCKLLPGFDAGPNYARRFAQPPSAN